jgi:site-specific DNA-methyltransferase (adenine-specific)
MTIPDVLEGRARWALAEGDNIVTLCQLPECSIDALVTDPPAGIGFMGKGWDSDKGGRERWQCWLGAVMLQVFRVLKPGAHGLVWALPRTSHWTATALENAGFDVRDRVSHLFGTGFPKNAKAQLKPAVEDWWLVRKPLEGTVAANVARWGTGAINVEGCRIAAADAHTVGRTNSGGKGGSGVYGESKLYDSAAHSSGRWPANLTLDEEAAAMLDAQSGVLKSGGRAGAKYETGCAPTEGWGHIGKGGSGRCLSDSGGASRFFYTAKTSRSERDFGCEALPREALPEQRKGNGVRNHHPTVKSLALMRWLVRLITPPGGVVLDPFAGSGSTGIAALQEGARFIGVEREAAYAEIARARIGAAAQGPEQVGLFERAVP